MRLTSTDPSIIRDALTYADDHGPKAAAEKYGYHPSTLTHWRRRSRDEPGWPTDSYIAGWRALAEERSAERRRHAAWTRDWRKAVYLQRGPMLIDGTGTARRLQALAALGWSSHDVATRLGVSHARVGHMRSGLWPKVIRRTAANVARVYDELSMTVPQDPPNATQGRVRVHQRTRSHARRVGWLPPLAWDDDTIDNPNTEPAFKHVRDITKSGVDDAVVERVLNGEKLRTTKAEKREILRRWIASGRTEREMCVRMGWRPGRYVGQAA